MCECYIALIFLLRVFLMCQCILLLGSGYLESASVNILPTDKQDIRKFRPSEQVMVGAAKYDSRLTNNHLALTLL
ncbi:hypothetical protein KSS87_015290 [Heliosperma pusillum]|nr:hypothetical protein KSS87_015290 [Heliosperma pusillum]